MNYLQHLIVIFALVSGLNVAPIATLAFMQSEPQVPAGAEVGAQEPQTSNADALLQAAIVLYRERKFDEALAYCTKASRLNPKDFRPQALAGYLYMAQMKYKSASEAFGSAILLQPDNKLLYLMKATADSGRNEKDAAIAACRKALEIDPAYAEAYGMIGEALRWDEKRQTEAITAYQSAIRINPDLLESYEPLGELLDDAKDQKRAEEVFRRGLAADPDHMTCRFALGRLLVKQGRLVEAREVWDGRITDEDNIHPQFIVLLVRAENLKRATDALAQKPNDPDALVEMGLAVMDGDSWVVDRRQERAMVYFRKALTRKPGHQRAQYAICKAYIQIADTFGDKKNLANQELAKLRRLNPALANELEEYRKSYTGGIPGGIPVNVNR